MEIKNIKALSVVKQIENLAEMESSGAIYLMNEKNVMAIFVLSEGQIVEIRYLTKRGIEALEVIFVTEQFKMFKFIEADEPTNTSEANIQLPSTTDILELIKLLLQPDGLYDGSESIDINQVKEIVVAELTLHLGPMAKIVAKNYLENTNHVSEILHSLENIANDIDDVDSKKEFIRNVTEKIQNMAEVLSPQSEGEDIDVSKVIDISQVKAIIIAELSLHLGPMAKLVTEKHLQGAKDFSDVLYSLDKIALEIDDSDIEKEFKRKMTEKIKKI